MKKLARLLGAVLVLMLAFSSVAFANISSDVKVTITSGDLTTLTSTVSKNGQFSPFTSGNTVALSADNSASPVVLSFDVTFKSSVTKPWLGLTFVSDDITSIDIISSNKTDGVTITNGTTVSKDVSFDVSVASGEILLTIRISGDKASGDAIVKVTINAKAVKPAFDSAKVPVYAAGKLVDTVTFTSADAKKSVTVSTDVTVSLDLSAASVDLVSVDGKALTGVSSVYSLDITTSSKDVYIYFTSADASFEATLTINVDSSSSATTETYVLNLSNDIKFIGSNGTTLAVAPKGNNVNLATDFATSQDNAKAWTPTVAFSVSSDVFTSFDIEISSDKAKAIVLKDPAGDAISDFDGKTIDPAGIEGAYTVVFSADLVLSGDTSKTSTDTGYFSIKVTVTSASVAGGSTEPGSESTEPSDTDTITAGKEVSAADAVTATSSAGGGTKIAAPGQKINNLFMNSSTGAVNATAIANFFSSITDTAEPATAIEMSAALSAAGITYDIGDSTKGFRAVGLKLDTPVSDDTPFFALVNHRTLAAGKHIGFGYTKTVNGIFIILFNLMRNPFNTTYFMEVDAGENDVAGTDAESQEEEDSTEGVTRVNKVVFMTADGAKAFAVKNDTDEPVTLQGQSQAGNNTDAPAKTTEDQETSSHGSSSGCDAGFGLIALAAVALAARKIRK